MQIDTSRRKIVKAPIELSYTNPFGNTYFGTVIGDENDLPFHYFVHITRMIIKDWDNDLFLRRVIKNNFEITIAKNVCKVGLF